MIHAYKHNSLTWLDLENPTREEIREIMDVYGIHELVAEELLSPSRKPKVDVYPDYMYLILHFPAFHHTHGEKIEQEVDFIVGKDFLITTRYEMIDPIHKFSKVFEVNSILDRSNIGTHAGFIFFYMIRKLYHSLDHELDFMGDQLRAIERRVFSGNEKEMVIELSNVSRELLHFKRALSAHHDVLESFSIAARKFFGEDFAHHGREIIGAYFKTAEHIAGNIEFLEELRETNNSLLSTKQNETMKVLAIISFVIFPLSLIASIFSLNTKYLPFSDSDWGFAAVMGIMVIATLCMFAFFKYKKWL